MGTPLSGPLIAAAGFWFPLAVAIARNTGRGGALSLLPLNARPARLPLADLSAGGKPDATMFYVIAERRMNGKLRKMYLSYASDTSAGGHIVSTMWPEQAYNSKKASILLASAVRLFPEWGFSLHPVNPGFLTLESAGKESDRDTEDFDDFYIPSRSPGRHWRVQLRKPQIGSPHIGAVEGIMQCGQFTYETSKVPRSVTFYLVHNGNSIKATLNALLMFMVKECYTTDYHAKAFIPQRYQA